MGFWPRRNAEQMRGARSFMLQSERWAVQLRHAAITVRHHRTSTVASEREFPGFIPRGGWWELAPLLCAVTYVSRTSAIFFFECAFF